MSEWLKEHAWKACIRQRIEGSNPFLSANKLTNHPGTRGGFLLASSAETCFKHEEDDKKQRAQRARWFVSLFIAIPNLGSRSKATAIQKQRAHRARWFVSLFIATPNLGSRSKATAIQKQRAQRARWFVSLFIAIPNLGIRSKATAIPNYVIKQINIVSVDF